MDDQYNYTSYLEDLLDDLLDARRLEEAVKVYEQLNRPFWKTQEIGDYYKSQGRIDAAMAEYDYLMENYLDIADDFLPLPGGPIELLWLGKWFAKTDPQKAEKYLRIYLKARYVEGGETLPFVEQAQTLLNKITIEAKEQQ